MKKPEVRPWQREFVPPGPDQLPLEPAVSEYGKAVARLTANRQRSAYLQGIIDRSVLDLDRGQADLARAARSLEQLVHEATRRWALAPGDGDAVTRLAQLAERADLTAGDRARLGQLIGTGTSLRAEMMNRQMALQLLDAAIVQGRAELAQLKADSDKMLQQTAKPDRTGAVTLRAGQLLLTPVRGALTSRFGNRYDPYFHRWQVHEGIDVGAGYGEPIRAAAPGVVRHAGWTGGYGNYTCIDHGKFQRQSLWTCYAHQSKLRVSSGQTVTAGQVIGEVGSTGASTGPHLHFEVRIGGEAVDPRPWLGNS